MFLIILFSSKLNLNNFHWTTDTQTRGKLGNEEAGLIPSTRNIPRTLQQWWRLNSKNAMEQTTETVDECPSRGGLDSGVKQWNLPLLLVFHLELPLLSWPVNILPILPGSAQTHSPRKPSWTHSLPAGFLRLCIYFFWRTCPILLNNFYVCT